MGLWNPVKGLNLLMIFICAVSRSGSIKALYIGYTCGTKDLLDNSGDAIIKC